MLRYTADLRTLGMVGLWFLLSIFAWALPLGWHTPVLVAAVSLVSFLCAVITHNTIHCPIFVSRGLNRLFQIVLTQTYGHPVSAYVPGHNLSHHRYVQTRKDVMRTSKLRFRWNLLNQLFFLPAVSGSILKADMNFAMAMYKQRPRWFQQFCIEWAAFLGVQIALLAIDWRYFLLYTFIPHNLAAWGIVGINFAQHDGCDVTDPYNHSRNFTGKLLNWFTFNNGFHGIHHKHPALHWSLAPEAHAKELAPFVHPNIDQPSLALWAWQAFIWPGVRLNYDGTPVVLPEEGPDEDWVSPRRDDAELSHLGAVDA